MGFRQKENTPPAENRAAKDSKDLQESQPRFIDTVSIPY
jgi:hypothetical protein